MKVLEFLFFTSFFCPTMNVFMENRDEKDKQPRVAKLSSNAGLTREAAFFSKHVNTKLALQLEAPGTETLGSPFFPC